MSTFLGSAGDDIANPFTEELTGFTGVAADIDAFLDPFGDLIEGRGGNDSIIGGPDIDTIYGGAGDDTLDGGQSRRFGAYGNLVYGDAGNDTITSLHSGYASLYGGAGNDTIDGRFHSGLVEGGAGSDRLIGGDDLFDATLSYRGSAAAVTIDLGRSRAAGGDAQGDRISGFRQVEGSAHADRLTGDGNTNFLRGGAGNDVLTGAGGDDILTGGIGRDRLFGGGGNDSLVADGGGDLFDGGAGIDTLSYADAARGVVVNLTTGATGGAADGDRFRSIENLVGSAFDDRLTGTRRGETLRGDAGDDRIFGGQGNDTLHSGTGRDSLYGGDGNDVIYLTGSSVGDDLVDGGAGEDRVIIFATFGMTGLSLNVAGAFRNVESIDTGSGHDTITGGRGNDTFGGGAGNDTLIGGDGDDWLTPGDGDDTIDGGAGRDTLVIDFAIDAVMINLQTGRASGDAEIATDRFRSIENVFIDYGGGDSTLIGSRGANSLTGSWGDDTLIGGQGNDWLHGEGGADTLTGGGGSDVFVFAVAFSTDRVTDFGGRDRIALDEAVFAALGPRVTADEIAIGSQARTADHHLIYDPRTGLLAYDSDGRGGAEARIFADVGRNQDLDHRDFLMI